VGFAGGKSANGSDKFCQEFYSPLVAPASDASMLQLWTVILQRSAFGNVDEDLYKALGIYGVPFGGVGTWFADAEGVNYAWSGAGSRMVWKVPEWGPGVWRDVTNAFLHNTTPFADWSDEFQREDMEDLGQALVDYGRGKRVFRALGILGGIWAPEGDM